MTRAVSKLILSTLSLAFFAIPGLVSAADKPSWTILVYANADHNLSPALVEDFLEMQKCGSDKDFNIVIQTDFQAHDEETYKAGLPKRYGKRVTRWLVTESNSKRVESEVVERLDEINSDIKRKLTDFVQWGLKQYPADRYGLILWDHGGGWTGFGGDSHNGRRKHVSPMKLNEIETAIEAGIAGKIDKFDFLSFDACLMANQEVISQISHLTKLYIACGEIDYGPGWNYEPTFKWLKAHPDCTLEDFAAAEAEAYEAQHKSEVDRLFMSHSAFDATLGEQFTRDAARFAAALRLHYNKHAARAQRDSAAYFVMGYRATDSHLNPFFDLGQMAAFLAENKKAAPRLRAAASRLVRTITAMRIANVSGTQKIGTGGINVYLPYQKPSRPSQAMSRFEKVEADHVIQWSRVVYAARKARAAQTNLPKIAVTNGPTNASFDVRVKSGDAYLVTGAVVKIIGNEILDIGEAGNLPLEGAQTAEIRWDRKLPCVRQNGKRIYLPAFAPPTGQALAVDVRFNPPGDKAFDGTIGMSVSASGELKFEEAVGAPHGGNPRGFEVKPGTVITGYLTSIKGGKVRKVLAEEGFTVPQDGFDKVPVKLEVLEPGDYFLAIQAEDSFGNGGEIEFKPVRIR